MKSSTGDCWNFAIRPPLLDVLLHKSSMVVPYAPVYQRTPCPSRTSGRPKTEECDRRAAAQTDQVTSQYDNHARPLPRLTVGQRVRIQDPTSLRWDKVGTVMGCGRSRQYEVRLPSGCVRWRNRRHLRPVPVQVTSTNLPPQSPVSPCSGQEKPSLDPPTIPRRSTRLAEEF